MEKKFVALKLKVGVGYCVHPTKFDRSIGDFMSVDGKAYIVIATGTRGECIEAANVEINEINEVTRAANKVTRAKSKAAFREFINGLNIDPWKR